MAAVSSSVFPRSSALTVATSTPETAAAKAKGHEWLPINLNKPGLIPSDTSTAQKTADIAMIIIALLSIAFLPLILIPIFYYTGKWVGEKLRTAKHSVLDQGPLINPKKLKTIDTEKYSYAPAAVNKLNMMKKVDAVAICVLNDVLKLKKIASEREEKASAAEMKKESAASSVEPKVGTEKKAPIEKKSNQAFLSYNGIPSKEKLKNALESGKLVIIPLGLTGGLFTRDLYSCEHMTTLIIDPKKRKIVYIDPQGKTLLDHAFHEVFTSCQTKNETQTVQSVYEDLIKTIKGIPTLKDQEWHLEQNTVEYQHDAYNCVVHFMHNAYEYAKAYNENHAKDDHNPSEKKEAISEPVEEQMQPNPREEIPKPLDTIEKVKAYRIKLIDEISEACAALPSNNTASATDTQKTPPKEESTSTQVITIDSFDGEDAED